jgi:hypothetical protein
METDIKIYCNCMRQIRDRINVVSTIMAGVIHVGVPGQPYLPDKTARIDLCAISKGARKHRIRFCFRKP